MNDKEYDVAEGVSLASFIEGMEIRTQGIAIALYYEVIPKDKWAGMVLQDGMELMLIHAVSGG